MTWVKPCDPEKSLPICDAHRESWLHRKTVKLWCIQEQPDFPIIPVFIILASWSEISLKSMTKCSLFFYDAQTSNKQLQLFSSKFSSSKHFGHEGKSPLDAATHMPIGSTWPVSQWNLSLPCGNNAICIEINQSFSVNLPTFIQKVNHLWLWYKCISICIITTQQ